MLPLDIHPASTNTEMVLRRWDCPTSDDCLLRHAVGAPSPAPIRVASGPGTDPHGSISCGERARAGPRSDTSLARAVRSRTRLEQRHNWRVYQHDR